MPTQANPIANDVPKGAPKMNVPASPLDFVGTGPEFTAVFNPDENIIVTFGQQNYYVGNAINLTGEQAQFILAAAQARNQSIETAKNYDTKVSRYKASTAFTMGALEAKACLEAVKAGDQLLSIRNRFLQPAVDEYRNVYNELARVDVQIDKGDFRAALREDRILRHLQTLDGLQEKNDFVRSLHKNGDMFGLMVCLSEPTYLTGIDEQFKAGMINTLAHERMPKRLEYQQRLADAIKAGERAWQAAMTHVVWSSGIATPYHPPKSEAVLQNDLPQVRELISSFEVYKNSERFERDKAMAANVA
ncbi:MAG: hypothetical protein GC179_30720 [Anaerolineaceae bacterium]|nr:hypothetical protein [Anaerolineaceae bacterium]